MPAPLVSADTDLTFFTNEPGSTLLDRFKQTLKDVTRFDVLVGYFRVSGFHQLHDALDDVDEIRILVGLNVGRRAFDLIEEQRNSHASDGQGGLDFTSHVRAKKTLRQRVIEEMDASEDARRVETGLRRFVEFLDTGKMQIKVYPSTGIHAKVYIGRFKEGDRELGHVLTGSSNFSKHGLVAQREFNVELKDARDVRFALEKFEELWADAVPVTEDYVDTLRTKTWLNDRIVPYDLYLKFLYEYFQEDINLDAQDDDLYQPEGFMQLEYQRQAVTSARKVLEAHGGVFIADVVGLGKTYIAAMLARQLPGRILVIAPPVLQKYWQETFSAFGIRGYRTESLGKLEHILREGHERYDYVIVDEAHRFRNELTQRYEMLHEICFGKRVVLVSATPLNNTVSDIYSLLKLFQVPKRSTIPGVPNLERFFRHQQQRLRKHDRDDAEYVRTAQDVSREVRDKVLKHVMIRRTRSEIAEYYSEDMEQQGLSFPDLEEPRRLIYAFTDEIEAVFTDTIEQLKDFSYARYTPKLYLKRELTPLEAQSQRNVGGFMKSILVKRLESSFHAFKKTLGRFVDSYERFIQMYEDGTVYIGKDVDVFDLLDNDDEEKLLDLVERERVQQYDAGDFTDALMEQLRDDLSLLRAIQRDWAPVEDDPKLDALQEALRDEPVLRDNRVLLFTESTETGQYLFEALSTAFPGEVMFYSSNGGVRSHKDRNEDRNEDNRERLSVAPAREVVEANFDPSARRSSDDVRILITTDVLAEGINLHRANAVVNYDLPWNPTRVLQRVGRVNRVGTAHSRVFVYNIFPTAQSDAHLGLEANVTSKLQAFHDTLGEDAKYLTDEEELSTHGLFGNEAGHQLFEKLEDKRTYEADEEAGPSELKYLQLLRTLRDEDPERFERIKELPKKARTARVATADEDAGVVTFFRKGKLEKFFFSATGDAPPSELTFFEAARLFECPPDAPRRALPDGFYQRLTRNKDAFDLTMAGETDAAAPRRGQSNEQYVLRRLKAKEMKRFKGFTEDDEDWMAGARRAFEDGVVPRNTAKKIKQAIEKEIDPLKVLAALRAHLPYSLIEETRRQQREDARSRREVILSEHLTDS